MMILYHTCSSNKKVLDFILLDYDKIKERKQERGEYLVNDFFNWKDVSSWKIPPRLRKNNSGKCLYVDPLTKTSVNSQNELSL